jgi:hypothetical protein
LTGTVFAIDFRSAFAFIWMGVSMYTDKHVLDTHVGPPDGTHLLFEGLRSEKLDRQQILMEAHLSVGIGESLEVSIEICGEPLPTELSFIPVPHAYVPGALVIIIYYAVMRRYLLDSILFGRHGERR